MSDNKLPTSSGWYTARWDGENLWTVTYFDRGHGEVCKATVVGAPEWSPSSVVVEWGSFILPTDPPDWTAAVADARRTLTHPTDYSGPIRRSEVAVSTCAGATCPRCRGLGVLDDRGFALVGQPYFDTQPCPGPLPTWVDPREQLALDVWHAGRRAP